MMDFDFALDTQIYFSGSDCNYSEHKIGSENVDSFGASRGLS